MSRRSRRSKPHTRAFRRPLPKRQACPFPTTCHSMFLCSLIWYYVVVIVFQLLKKKMLLEFGLNAAWNLAVVSKCGELDRASSPHPLTDAGSVESRAFCCDVLLPLRTQYFAGRTRNIALYITQLATSCYVAYHQPESWWKQTQPGVTCSTL